MGLDGTSFLNEVFSRRGHSKRSCAVLTCITYDVYMS